MSFSIFQKYINVKLYFYKIGSCLFSDLQLRMYMVLVHLIFRSNIQITQEKHSKGNIYMVVLTIE